MSKLIDKFCPGDNVLDNVLGDQPTPGAGVKVLTAPMFTKL